MLRRCRSQLTDRAVASQVPKTVEPAKKSDHPILDHPLQSNTYHHKINLPTDDERVRDDLRMLQRAQPVLNVSYFRWITVLYWSFATVILVVTYGKYKSFLAESEALADDLLRRDIEREKGIDDIKQRDRARLAKS